MLTIFILYRHWWLFLWDSLAVFLPREATMLVRVLGIVILSVTLVLCDETKEHTDEILTPHEGAIYLVF